MTTEKMSFCVSLGSSVTLPLKLEPLGVVKTGCLCLGPTSLISFCGCATLLTACGGSSESGLHLSCVGTEKVEEVVSAVPRRS